MTNVQQLKRKTSQFHYVQCFTIRALLCVILIERLYSMYLSTKSFLSNFNRKTPE